MMKAPKKIAIYRQGDVLLKKVDALPAGLTPVNWEDRVVLAYGEVTGHAHAISTLQAQMFITQGERYLEILPGGAELVHEEHGTIALPEGFYKVVQQREYVPQSAPRDVLD